MTRWTVGDVMTPSTVHARVGTPFKELARLAIEARSTPRGCSRSVVSTVYGGNRCPRGLR